MSTSQLEHHGSALVRHPVLDSRHPDLPSRSFSSGVGEASQTEPRPGQQLGPVAHALVRRDQDLRRDQDRAAAVAAGDQSEKEAGLGTKGFNSLTRPGYAGSLEDCRQIQHGIRFKRLQSL